MLYFHSNTLYIYKSRGASLRSVLSALPVVMLKAKFTLEAIYNNLNLFELSLMPPNDRSKNKYCLYSFLYRLDQLLNQKLR